MSSIVAGRRNTFASGAELPQMEFLGTSLHLLSLLGISCLINIQLCRLIRGFIHKQSFH